MAILHRLPFASCVLASLAAALVACSSDSTSSDGGRDEGGTISCRDNPRGPCTGEPGASRRDAHFVLTAAVPAPPEQGRNQWTPGWSTEAGNR